MTERATKKITTQNGTEVVYKSWISGREANDLQAVYLNSAKLSIVDNKPKIDSFDVNIETEATKKLIEIVVVSVKTKDDKEARTQNLVDAILDLPSDEYEEIVAVLNLLSKKK